MKFYVSVFLALFLAVNAFDELESWSRVRRGAPVGKSGLQKCLDNFDVDCVTLEELSPYTWYYQQRSVNNTKVSCRRITFNLYVDGIISLADFKNRNGESGPITESVITIFMIKPGQLFMTNGNRSIIFNIREHSDKWGYFISEACYYDDNSPDIRVIDAILTTVPTASDELMSHIYERIPKLHLVSLPLEDISQTDCD